MIVARMKVWLAFTSLGAVIPLTINTHLRKGFINHVDTNSVQHHRCYAEMWPLLAAKLENEPIETVSVAVPM